MVRGVTGSARRSLTATVGSEAVSFSVRSTYEVYQVVEAELIAAPSQQRVTVMTRSNPTSDPRCANELAECAEHDAYSSWYFVTEDEKFSFLTLSADSWRLAAKCDGAGHDATATDVANPTYGLG